MIEKNKKKLLPRKFKKSIWMSFLLISIFPCYFFGRAAFAAMPSEYINETVQQNVDKILGENENEEVDQPDLEKKLSENLDTVHIPFVENAGQIKNEDVKYYADIFSGRFFVANDSLTYTVKKSENNALEDTATPQFSVEESDSEDKFKSTGDVGNLRSQEKNENLKKMSYSFREQFVNSDGQAIEFNDLRGELPADTKLSDFRGNDPNSWKGDLKSFNLLSLGQLWPNIDVDLKAYGMNIEKIFTINPGAKPEDIKLRVEGAEKLELDQETGELLLVNEKGNVSLTKPSAYQFNENNERVDLAVKYVILDNNSYSFQVENFDPEKPLIIDPLLASTYIGGDTGDEWFGDIDLDSSGNIYFTSQGESDDYPTTVGVWDEVWNGSTDAVVSKLDADLEELLASTYIGGTGYEFAYAIHVDSSDKVWITGTTRSTDFPTTGGAWDTTLGGTRDVFVSKLSNDLVSLEASTYLGGSSGDDGTALVSDGAGNIIVTGMTGSADYPTTAGAADTVIGNSDAFVTKMNGTLSGPLIASTLLGGTINNEQAWSVKLDPSGNIFVFGETGWTSTTFDFPATAGAYDETYNGGSRDAFLAKLNPGLTSILAATHLGGDNWDLNMGVLPQNSMNIDSQGNVFIVSMEASTVFPSTPEAFDPYRSGSGPLFISKFSNDLSTLLASTFFEDEEYGGGGSDWQVLDFDSEDNVIVHGYAGTRYLPTTPGAIDETNDDWSASFYAKFDNDLRYVYYSTFLESAEDPGEFGFGIAVDGSDNVYGSGWTMSGNSTYPTTEGAYDRTSVSTDGYISKISMTPEAQMDHYTVHTNLIEDLNFSQGFEDAGFPPSGWTTGGNANWDRTLAQHDEGVASAASGIITHNQTSWIDREYDFAADGFLEFKWKVDSEITYDSLLFCLDNDYCTRTSGYDRKISGDNDWKEEKIPLTKGNHKLRWMYVKDGSGTWGGDQAWLDAVKFEYYTPTIEGYTSLDTEGFEDAGFPPAGWTTGGNANWDRTLAEQFEGAASAASGTIANSQSSWLDIDYDFPVAGAVKFNWKVSADSSDSLVFCIDRDSTCNRYSENDGVIAGIKDWAEVQAFVPAGTHSFRWMYSKDSWGSAGEDKAWIDNVRFESVQYSPDLETQSGVANTAVITAYDNADRKRAVHEGDHTITLSGAGIDGEGHHPTCTDKDGNVVEFGNPMTVTFANGVATCNMTLYNAETAEVEASDGTYDSNDDPVYHLEALVTGGVPGPVLSPANSQLSASPNPADIGNLVTITLTAYDESGNPYTTGGDTVVLSVTGANTASPTVTDNGNGTYTASYTAANSGEDLITGTMNGIAIGADTDGTSDGTFHESITASTCVVDATKTTIAVAPNPVEKGSLATVTVTTFDSGGSVCTVSSILTIAVSGPETLTLDPTNNGNGTYTSIFTPQVSGTYTVTATLGGQAASTDLEVTEAAVSTACGNKSSIDLVSSKNKRLKFDICILAGDEASSKDISKKKDQTTGLRKLSLEAVSSHGIEGELKVATVSNPQDILSRPSKLQKSKTKKVKKVKKLKVRKNSQLFKQSYLSGNYLTYKVLKLSPSFSQKHLEKGQLFLRVPKDWIQKNRIKEIQFIRSDNREEEMLKSQEDDSSSSDIIYKVTTTSQLSKYISIVGLPYSSIGPAEPNEPSELDEPTSEPIEPEITETPSEPAAPQGNLRQPTEENELKASEDSLEPRSVLMEFMDMLKRALFAHPLIRNVAAAYAIAAAGLALPLLPFLFELNSVSDIWLIFKESTFRLFGILFSKKKKRGWGIVYDKVTGQPVPLATVNIYDDQGKRRESKVTDSHGIYFFLVTPGKFVLEAIKRGYRTFIPDSNREINVFYEADYKGGILNITDPDLVNLDIPLELQSANPFRLFFRKKFVESALWIIFWVGLATNILISIYFPSTINYIITALYIILAVARNLCLKSFQWGQVFDSAGKPVVFSEVRILNPGDQRTVARTLTDELGRYLIILKEGSYILEVRSRENALLHHSEFSIEEMGAVDARIEVG